jgi:alkylated DNA repair dioxygenase AlkB
MTWYLQNNMLDEQNTTTTTKTLTPMLESGCTISIDQKWLSPKKSVHWEKLIMENAKFSNETGFMMGKSFVSSRKTCYYGTTTYKYAGGTRVPQAWPEWILPLKKMVEETCNCEFNFLLINHYADGKVGLGYHSDDEKDLDRNSPIASLSLGSSRDFLFKHKTRKDLEVIKLVLDAGTLLIMDGGETQKSWKHSIPVRKKCTKRRLNLTFRVMKENTNK